MAVTRRRKAASEDLEARALAEVEKGKLATDAEAVARAMEVFDLLKRLSESREAERALKKKHGDAVIAAEQALKSSIELEVSTTEARIAKLDRVIMAWQDLADAKTEKGEALAEARNTRVGLEQRISELVDDARQLGLFSETIRDELREKGALPSFDPETGEVLDPEGDAFFDPDDDGAPDPGLEPDDDDGPFEPFKPAET